MFKFYEILISDSLETRQSKVPSDQRTSAQDNLLYVSFIFKR